MRLALFIYFIGLLYEGQAHFTNTFELEPPLRRRTLYPTSLRDIFISVKTTHKNHKKRLGVILRSWYQLAKYQTWFFTDRDDPVLQQYTGGHMVHTHCPPTHARFDLCCKTNVEYDTFMKTNKRWFCHFDDDVFVNVPGLVAYLQTFDPTEKWYIGSNLTFSRNNGGRHWNKHEGFHGDFQYANGPAYCLSRSVAKKMFPYASNGRLTNLCEKMEFVDDETIGYIVAYKLKVKLTIAPEFHIQYEKFSELDPSSFSEQVSFSYMLPHNVLKVPGPPIPEDHTRFLALYEYLYRKKAKEPNHVLKETMEPSAADPRESRESKIRVFRAGRKMLLGKRW